MFLNIPLIAVWHAITQRREHLIHENLMRENQKRMGYDYGPQQMVLRKNGNLRNKMNEQVVHTKCTNPCQWDSDHPTETRSHRKNEYKANNTISVMINYQLSIPPTSPAMGHHCLARDK
jgi:hypothetical protein